MSAIAVPTVSDSEPLKSERSAAADDTIDAQSTTSADSGNGSLNNSSMRECAQPDTPPWPLGAEAHEEQQESPSTMFPTENQPLIVKDVDESVPSKNEKNGVCEKWAASQHLSSALTASKGSVCSSSAALCRICHTECESSRDPFVSPCRCSGSLLYVHRSCLVHWLELSTRKMMPSPRCELCGYNYRRRNYINLSSLHFPHLSTRDRLLNILFIIVFIIMVVCAVLSIHFLQLSEQYHSTLRGYRVVSSSLSDDDVTVVVCSVLFFAAFFIAVFTQYRAEASVCRVLFRCWTTNINWTIRHYDIRDDPEMLAQRQARSIENNLASTKPGRSDGSTKMDNRMPTASRQLPITVMEVR
uniref:RING-CH-type domain-containing protein n=1 Tax=Haemonchus contortus TaxID=6289 RepID=A0A7I4XZ19_HAECO|nr:Zinc finger domain containing protein [Haemonchus contortus]